jgi:hypothetical protein
MLAPSEQEERELVGELMRIAARYQNSVELRASMVTKPNIGPTLRSLAEQSVTLSQSLSDASTENHIAAVLAPLTVRSFKAGTDAIHVAAEVLEHVGEVLNRHVCLRSDPGEQIAERWANMSRTAAQAETLARMLTNLPIRCEWELVLLQQYEALVPDPSSIVDRVQFVRELTSNLTRLCLAASELVSQKRGPDCNTPQMLAVLELKSVFERRAGLQATHSTKSGRAYSGRPESSFGVFATAAFEMMEPDARRRRGLSEAITFAVWPSRGFTKAADIPAQTADRELAIREALLKASVTNFSPPT